MKRKKRTDLHGHFLLEHLKAGTIPRGLQIRNIPVIFTEDPLYKKGYSYIETKCSSGLMVLTVETAQRISKQQIEKLEALESEIKTNQSITDAKALLEN